MFNTKNIKRVVLFFCLFSLTAAGNVFPMWRQYVDPYMTRENQSRVISACAGALAVGVLLGGENFLRGTRQTMGSVNEGLQALSEQMRQARQEVSNLNRTFANPLVGAAVPVNNNGREGLGSVIDGLKTLMETLRTFRELAIGQNIAGALATELNTLMCELRTLSNTIVGIPDNLRGEIDRVLNELSNLFGNQAAAAADPNPRREAAEPNTN